MSHTASIFKILGGIFLIIGTSIGGAMFALPLANAEVGFPIAAILLLICWLAMTFSALLILEVNLSLPSGSNLISMAQATLGRPGAVLAWSSYLLLLYSLLSAYISGGSDVLQSVLGLVAINLPHWVNIILFVTVLGSVVYLGIQSVDYVNTGLMLLKVAVYVLLVIFIAPFMRMDYLTHWQFNWTLTPIMVLITAFGYAIIIPSLRCYFEPDVGALRKVVIIGSTIPLAVYLLWDAVIMGVVPHMGSGGLTEMWHSDHATTQLTAALSQQLQSNKITDLFRIFASISMLTAFLAVSLSLTDFLADGLKISKRGVEGWLIYGLTFIPPILIVLINPNIFLAALSYAGIFCVVLMLLLPLGMAWGSRYWKKFSSPYQVPGGKPSLVIGIIAGIGFLGIGIIERIYS